MALSDFASVTADDLVTGEGVALDLPPASVGLRMASGLIDVLITFAVLIASVLLLLAATVATDDALVQAGLVLATVGAFVGLPVTLETLTRGRSVGHLALGLRTVRDDGGAISFQHALVRALIGFVEIYSFYGVPAFFSVLISSRGKRLGDFAAGTVVVRERQPLVLPPPAVAHPQLAAWARSADITALPTGVALAARQFLSRGETIDPAARHRVGGELLALVAPYVAPPPPADAPPDLVLAAIIAERRDRDLRRMARDRENRSRLLGPRQ
ncbi:RDD family protein [Nocardioides ultimimeridianus]